MTNNIFVHLNPEVKLNVHIHHGEPMDQGNHVSPESQDQQICLLVYGQQWHRLSLF